MTKFTGKLPFQTQTKPYIALAPMEGLMDGNFREVLTAVGGIDHCVTEFIRVTNTVFPEKVFYRLCPELKNQGKTQAGTPVHVQLLGSSPEFMAKNAVKAARLGAPAIDINFGCPAKTVNKNMGGAVLLQYPEQLYRIASAVREAVPSHIPVSAKMRLGFNDKSLALENAEALASADIQWLTIHARTRLESYRPPAYWDWISKIKQYLIARGIQLPIIANGEIWNTHHAYQCLDDSGCDLLMIGRGLVAVPDLGLQIKHNDYNAIPWHERLNIILNLIQRVPFLSDKQLSDRIKQWLHYMSNQCSDIRNIFDTVKRIKEADAIINEIRDRATHS